MLSRASTKSAYDGLDSCEGVAALTRALLGDGIGAEVSESLKTIFKADNVPINWEQVDVSGVDTGDKRSEDLFRESIASLKKQVRT
ncbi:MAG: isocitrate dehydrogenase (NAD(+)) idh1 [Geoglossum umbratile]|nr:MAG: isocitrate dehydrogenase (NAD(+)) idh1 [Geoglossum umbratile]